MAGFRNSACGLQAPDFGKYEANSPSVSGHYRENSRFQETAAGDRVRSPLAWRQQSMAIIPVGAGVGKKNQTEALPGETRLLQSAIQVLKELPYLAVKVAHQRLTVIVQRRGLS